jgi:lambda repressor-like predicted transcriptional regulator
VRLVLHTNHPVPGLRVDQLITNTPEMEVNEARQKEAEGRILAAVERLQQRGKLLTVTAVAQEAGAHKATVSRVLGQRCIPLENIINRGMHRVPKCSDDGDQIPPEQGAFSDISSTLRQFIH